MDREKETQKNSERHNDKHVGTSVQFLSPIFACFALELGKCSLANRQVKVMPKLAVCEKKWQACEVQIDSAVNLHKQPSGIYFSDNKECNS